jgi:hypothetical protein
MYCGAASQRVGLRLNAISLRFRLLTGQLDFLRVSFPQPVTSFRIHHVVCFVCHCWWQTDS